MKIFPLKDFSDYEKRCRNRTLQLHNQSVWSKERYRDDADHIRVERKRKLGKCSSIYVDLSDSESLLIELYVERASLFRFTICQGALTQSAKSWSRKLDLYVPTVFAKPGTFSWNVSYVTLGLDGKSNIFLNSFHRFTVEIVD